MEKTFYRRVAHRLWHAVDTFATDIINSDKADPVRKRRGTRPVRTKLLSPEEEVRKLMTSAACLEDVWRFFLHRLQNGADLEFLCLSIPDESGDMLRLRFLHPEPATEGVPMVSMAEARSHLVQAYNRKDTTFTADLRDLGQEVTLHLGLDASRPQCLNLFSVPLIAANQTIGMLTLGFSEIDAFSQATLSYVYTLRDQVAQLVWNLILQERMQGQAQIDSLTGLLSHSSFQQILDLELTKAEAQAAPVTVMILDINNIRAINGSLGHHAGDEAIRQLASTVRRLSRGLDTVARYGGDEVVLILPETDRETADVIAERFMQGLRERTGKALQPFSISVGYATYPADTQQRDDLLKLAEQALQLAKFKGAKTGESTRIACHEMDDLSDKTILEVFASHIAKKYDTPLRSGQLSLFQELVRRVENIEQLEQSAAFSPDHLMLETISSLAGALEAKDKYTRGHSQAVANYAVALAHALQLSPDEVEQVRLAAFLHDIGKIGIPEAILCKAGALNEKEWEIMKQHPVIGARQIIAPVTGLRDIIPMVEYHHENWDGSGYPEGLRGEAIPLGARIVSIVDAFHGLTSDRSYRKALTVPEARQVLEAGSGTKWDPSLIQVFFNILTIATPKHA